MIDVVRALRCCCYTWLVASPLTRLHVTVLVVVEEDEFLLEAMTDDEKGSNWIQTLFGKIHSVWFISNTLTSNY